MHNLGYVPMVRSGDKLSARSWNRGAQLIGNVAGPQNMIEGSGVVVKPVPGLPPGWEYFELKADLTPGQTTAAYRLQDDGAGGLERIDTDPPNEDWEEATIRDTLGTTRGKGADDAASPDPIPGTIVMARQVGDEWHIVSAQPWPKVVQGLLDDDVLANSSTFKIKAVQTLFPVGATAIEHLLDNEDKLTLHNVFGLDGREDALTFAVWNEEQVRYDALAPYLGGQILWAKVYGTFTNVDGDECHPVEVVACDHDGENAQLETFTILTHIKPRATTDLEDGDVVGYVRLVGVTIGESPSETDIAGIIVTDIWETGGEGVMWAKVQSGFTNASGDTQRTVSVIACDPDGTGEDGDAFNIKTPLKASADTSLFTGYVVGYVDAGTNKTIVTPCFDDPIGTIKMVNADAAIRDGWAEYEAMRGRFPIGMEAAKDWAAYEASGGAATHTHDNHDEHDGACFDVSGPDGTWLVTSGIHTAHSTANHLSPWRALKFIERID